MFPPPPQKNHHPSCKLFNLGAILVQCDDSCSSEQLGRQCLSILFGTVNNLLGFAGRIKRGKDWMSTAIWIWRGLHFHFSYIHRSQYPYLLRIPLFQWPIAQEMWMCICMNCTHFSVGDLLYWAGMWRIFSTYLFPLTPIYLLHSFYTFTAGEL